MLLTKIYSKKSLLTKLGTLQNDKCHLPNIFHKDQRKLL